jgi:hypothetical protein
MRTVPLLAVALEGAAAAVPPAVEHYCRNARVMGAMRALVAQHRLGEIGRAFGVAGIQHMVLKGLPLALELYPDPGLRPSTDIDILVRPKDRDAAISALMAEGYDPVGGAFPLRFFKAHHFHAALERAGGRDLPVEVHWDTQPFYSLSRIPEEGLWERSREVTIGEKRMRIPGREENLLYLVQHLSRHALGLEDGRAGDPLAVFLEPWSQGRLIWIADLMLLEAGQPPLDECRIDSLSKRWGLERDLRAARGLRRRLEELRAGEKEEHASSALGGRASGAKLTARRFPSLGRTSKALHLRPVLVVDALRCAFPGSAWIRTRYDLRDAWAVKVALRAVRHSLWVGWKLGRLLGSALAEVVLQTASSVRREFRQRRALLG